MTLALLCLFTAHYVSDVNTSIFRSLRLLGSLLCRLYCAVMVEVYVLIYLSSGKCYTYIMCRVWLWVSVFLQACGVLWFLNLPYKSAHLVRSKKQSPYLGAFAKLRKATVSSAISVHFSVYQSVRMQKLGSHWTEFHEIRYVGNFKKSVVLRQVSLKSD